jgi:hypothetical protein
MLFFDDDSWNIREVSSLGVKCVLTPDGVTDEAFKEGLAMFEKNECHELKSEI